MTEKVFREEVLLIIAKTLHMKPQQIITNMTLQYSDYLLNDNFAITNKEAETLRAYLKQNKYYPFDSE